MRTTQFCKKHAKQHGNFFIFRPEVFFALFCVDFVSEVSDEVPPASLLVSKFALLAHVAFLRKCGKSTGSLRGFLCVLAGKVWCECRLMLEKEVWPFGEAFDKKKVMDPWKINEHLL